MTKQVLKAEKEIVVEPFAMERGMITSVVVRVDEAGRLRYALAELPSPARWTELPRVEEALREYLEALEAVAAYLVVAAPFTWHSEEEWSRRVQTAAPSPVTEPAPGVVSAELVVVAPPVVAPRARAAPVVTNPTPMPVPVPAPVKLPAAAAPVAPGALAKGMVRVPEELRANRVGAPATLATRELESIMTNLPPKGVEVQLENLLTKIGATQTRGLMAVAVLRGMGKVQTRLVNSKRVMVKRVVEGDGLCFVSDEDVAAWNHAPRVVSSEAVEA